jgi:hypothetical protein
MAVSPTLPGMDFEEVPRTAHADGRVDGSEFPGLSNPSGKAPGDQAAGDYESRIRGMIDDAREFCAEVLLPIRVKGQQYYLGMYPEVDDESEGTSTIVKTEVKDTILQMLPSLMRIFTRDSTVNFIPNNEKGAQAAEQAEDYLRYVLFNDNPGYMIVQDVMKDAMIKSMGIVTWWTDDNLEILEETYDRMSMEQRQFIISQKDVEVVKMEQGAIPGPQGELIPVFNLVIRRNKRAPKHMCASVPPDEFRINRMATCVKDAALVGRERFATQSELVKKGVDRALIDQNRDFSGGDMRFSEERMLRNPGADSPFGRDSMEPLVRWGEYWIRADKDLDGIAELRYVCTIGDNHDIVHDVPAVRAKIAIACTDPEPHSIVGHSVSELVADLQVIGSNLLRGSLDSMAQSIYPRLWGVENQVNWDDLLNTAIGQPIRVKSPGVIGQLQYDFIGEDAFSMMDRLDGIRMARTGITEQSKGLDPKALQSTTAQGVGMVVQGAQERIELVARTMASTFFVDFMTGLLQEITDHPSPERVVELRGTYVPVNPSQFDATMTCIPNPAIGRGSDMDRFMMLQMVLGEIKTTIQAMGPLNPLCGPVEYRNCMTDILAIGGMRNVQRYYKPMGEKEMKGLAETLQQKEDPQMVYAKAEADKVRAQVVKILTDARVKVEDLTQKNDRERDKNEGDQLLKAAELIGKFMIPDPTASLQAQWDVERQPATPGAAPTPGGEAGPPLPGAAGAAPSAALGAPKPGGEPPMPEMPLGPPTGLLGAGGPGQAS